MLDSCFLPLLVTRSDLTRTVCLVILVAIFTVSVLKDAVKFLMLWNFWEMLWNLCTCVRYQCTCFMCPALAQLVSFPFLCDTSISMTCTQHIMQRSCYPGWQLLLKVVVWICSVKSVYASMSLVAHHMQCLPIILTLNESRKNANDNALDVTSLWSITQ